jgi:GGDEF domain-containing protein
LHNRTFFATELERITEQKLWPLCIVAMDLNGLKHVNDVHGPHGQAMVHGAHGW